MPFSIHVLAKPKKEGMWLRWAPANAAAWSLGNKYGYTIERFTLRSDGELESPLGEKLTNTPIRPISESAFDKLANEVPEASVVQELIYGEDALKTFDANSPASVLTRNQEVENQFGIALLMCDLSRQVAEAAGLFFIDPSTDKGKRYIYRISIAFQPKGGKIEPGVIVTEATEEKPIPPIKDLSAEFGDHKATLKWSTLMHRGMYSAYFIERSTDGKAFHKISDLPYIHLSASLESDAAFFVDSLELNDASYHYRIFGITPFAEQGPVSNVASGSGKDDLSGFLIIREGKGSPDKKITLKWEFPAELESKVAGFVVARAAIASGPYQDVNTGILPKNLRTFLDVTPLYNSYYVLKALDNAGKVISRSFPFLVQVEDTTPPVVPVGLKGEVDKNGKATLTWKPNTDADLLGYRVFQSNSTYEEFTEVTKDILLRPGFTDSLNINVLNKHVYYTIVAVDKNYNPSAYASYIKLSRPDVIPPAAPVFTQAEVKEGKIGLAWDNSDNPDAAKLELTRIEKDDRIQRPVMTWAPPSLGTSFSEPFLTLGKTYQYKLTVTDSAGNKSETFSRDIFYETGVRPPVTGLHTEVDREGKKIVLKWKNNQNAVKCMIYRSKNESAFTLYQTLEGNIEIFTDKGITANNTYNYKIQLTHPKGVRSILSDAIVVKY